MDKKNGSQQPQPNNTVQRHPNLRKFSPLLLVTFIAAGLFLVFTPTTTKSFSKPEPPPYICPTEIDVIFPGGWNSLKPGKYRMSDIHLLHDVLARCDTVKTIKIRNDNSGCESPTRYSLPFDFPSGTPYPSQIKELELMAYNFNENDWERAESYRPSLFDYRNVLRWFQWGGGKIWLKGLLLRQKHLTNLDLWLKSMDFSHIETFSYRPTDDWYVPNATPLTSHLPSLKSFTAYGPWAKDFILALPQDSLTHLAWIHSGQTGTSALPILRHHAKSLMSLKFHEPESVYRERRVMTADEIAALGSTLPNLRSITLDIKQNGTWGWDHLEALATNFPNLENATIFYEMASDCRRQLNPSFEVAYVRQGRKEREIELGCEGSNAMAQPSLGVHNAPVPFEFLVKKNVGGKLKQVVFYSGGWEDRDEGGMLYFDWVHQHRAWAVCRVIQDENSLAADISTPAIFDEGDRVIGCQNANKRRFKTISDVKSRRTGFEVTSFEKPDQDLAKQVSRMEL
ncbi:uncharacterized protein CTRU02_208551 [Colletotrichum truncatum]|uniref:Uncharacterized protein n=1 Tax=Colletotrichum truncatum TaxID=5467 RepID=A0ACC3YWP2_COLTU|nr:uncharacterized protein CTRU02_10307 [Colletotrichum truncatum]KAF6787510.1 hypothetical protein CTRU02_10307 [Colletotrichum truncatum]